jgi:hypothetical protein
MPSFNPMLAEVLECGVGTVRHIPAMCRLQVAVAIGGILSRLVQNPTWEDAYRLLALPKMVLVASKRGGVRHPQDAANEITRRLAAA